MGVIITYDVNNGKQAEMKECLIAKGYFDNWYEGAEGNKTKVHLPYTTLWKKEGTPAQGLADMQACAERLKIKLLRAVAIDDSKTASIPGVP